MNKYMTINSYTFIVTSCIITKKTVENLSIINFKTLAPIPEELLELSGMEATIKIDDLIFNITIKDIFFNNADAYYIVWEE